MRYLIDRTDNIKTFSSYSLYWCLIDRGAAGKKIMSNFDRDKNGSKAHKTNAFWPWNIFS